VQNSAELQAVNESLARAKHSCTESAEKENGPSSRFAQSGPFDCDLSRVRQLQLFGAVVGFFGAGRGALKKRLTGANELLGPLLVNGFAMELGGIEQ